MTKHETPDLEFTGDNRHLIGIPARDLTSEEIEANGWNVEELLGSGLYKPAKKPAEGKE